MTRPAAAIHEPRWAQSWTGPELTANDHFSGGCRSRNSLSVKNLRRGQQRLRQGKSTCRKDRHLSGRRIT